MNQVNHMMIGMALSVLSANSMALPAKEIGIWKQSCQHTMAPLVAEDGADRLNDRRVAEGGADRLIERRVAEDGSDRLNAGQMAENDAVHSRHV